jgi:hypothetical protein
MEFRALQSLALKVGEARSQDEVFKCVVNGLAAQEDVALARVWLILPGDICNHACYGRTARIKRDVFTWSRALVTLQPCGRTGRG